MMRSFLLWLSRNKTVRSWLISWGLARRAARRFVAGETIGEAIQAIRELSTLGITATLDHLGENVETAEGAARATEDYLKAIYQLSTSASAVTTTALAHEMGVSAASATNMMKKLAELKLVRHSPYRGATLTRTGEKMALEIVRHHRLLELFLNQALDIPWDQVHEEAHRLEHVLSDTLEDHIAEFLGDPKQDPHGDPIPSKNGSIAGSDQRSPLRARGAFPRSRRTDPGCPRTPLPRRRAATRERRSPRDPSPCRTFSSRRSPRLRKWS